MGYGLWAMDTLGMVGMSDGLSLDMGQTWTLTWTTDRMMHRFNSTRLDSPLLSSVALVDVARISPKFHLCGMAGSDSRFLGNQLTVH